MQKIEFTLSAEDYLELNEHRLKKEKRRAAAISAFTGLALILIGYCYLHFLPNANSLFGLIFLGAGLLVAFLAVPCAFPPSKAKDEDGEAAVRAEYRRSIAGARSFEFDDAGWTYGVKGA